MDTVVPSLDADHGTLKFDNDYPSYFALVQTALSRYAGSYSAIRPIDDPALQDFEAMAFDELAQRLLGTIAALRYRFVFRDVNERQLYVDLSDSGFPNFQEISRMESDLADAATKLAQMPAPPVLKRKLVDRIIRSVDANPQDELAQLGERSYLESLADPAKLFLTITDGPLKRISANQKFRRYVYAYGAYDPSANLPLIYVLLFDQSVAEPPLEEPGPHRDAFRAKMRAEASHASPLGIMAVAIDDLPNIAPKMLKRITIGPLFAPLIFDGRDATTLSDREQLISALCTASDEEQPFLLCGSEEIVVSEREERASTSFLDLGATKKVRQIFRFAADDPELFGRKISVLRRYALLPHRMSQELSSAVRSRIPELGDSTVLIPYNEKGVTNVIGQRPERASD